MTDFNTALVDDLRANSGEATGGPFVGRQMIILTTTGAKSGRRQTTPLVYTVDGDRHVIVASMGGAPKHPGWYHNIVANPVVTVEVNGKTWDAVATIAQGTERERLYQQHAGVHASFHDYPKLTTRVIPVIVLDRKAAIAA